METIGIIGVGQMGTPLAKNLLKGGYPVVAYDIKPQQIESLAKFGAAKATGPRDLAARSDVVLTVLTWPKVVEEVILGPNGVLEGLKKGAVIIECSSIDHETSIRLAEKVESAGGRFVEAALMGQPPEIEAKGLYFLTAGTKEVVEECAPIFGAMGRKVLYAGGFGAAKLLKIANAMLNATETIVAYEVLTWCLRNQITQEGFLEIMTERRPERAQHMKEILDGGLNTRPSWTAKDVYHGLKLAEGKEIPTPVVSAVNAVINLAKSENREGYSFGGMMWKFYERIAKNC